MRVSCLTKLAQSVVTRLISFDPFLLRSCNENDRAQSRFSRNRTPFVFWGKHTLYRGELKFRTWMSYVFDFKGSNLHSALWESRREEKHRSSIERFRDSGRLRLCAGSLCERYILSDAEVTALRGFFGSKLLRIFLIEYAGLWERYLSRLQSLQKKSDRDFNLK